MFVDYRSLTQGIVAGGSAAYLYGRTQEQAHQNTSDTWMSVALQVNHLLLLTAENMALAGSPMGMFGSVVRAAPVLGAFTAVASICNKDVAKVGSLVSPKRIEQFNTLYRVGVVASSCATLALGSPLFAAGSLAMLAIDVVAKGKSKEVFDMAKKVAAAAAFVGYGMQIFASEKIGAVVAKVSTFVTGVKLFSDLPIKGDQNNQVDSSDDDSHACCHGSKGPQHSSDRPDRAPSSPIAAPRESGNIFTRGSVY